MDAKLYSEGTQCYNVSQYFQIQFHGQDLSSLHRIVKPEILPNFLGGTIEWNTQNSILARAMMEKDEFYKGFLTSINLVAMQVFAKIIFIS